jgi:hypothetical protein
MVMISRDKIQMFVDQVVERFQPRKVILFGSYAHGNPTEDSDVDIMLVMPHRGRGRALRRGCVWHVREIFHWISWCDHPQRCGGALRWVISFSGKWMRRESCCMKATTRERVDKAEADYAAAVMIRRSRKKHSRDIVCFHLQQCVEKYLKGRLEEAGLAIPKIHDLERLLPVESM